MSLTRRDLLKIGPITGVSLAMGDAFVSAQEPLPTPPRDAVGMLYDSTKCIGCKSCVVACADANGLQPDTRVDSLHQAPNDLNSFTKNIIKLYKPKDGSGTFAFVKRQCMHCVDPFCVAACPFHALEKDKVTGVVSWTADKCIGCRYCQLACPYQIPKFDWDAFNAKIVKCEFCKERLGAGKEPACTYVCPPKAVIFGKRDILLREGHRRIEAHPGKYFENRVYGEKEAGGTQVLYLSAVNFDLLGLPHLSSTEHPTNWLRWQERALKYFLLPISIYGVMVAFLKQNFREHEAEIDEEHKKTGLIPQL
jgi:Fe-S-cluster-containing dehydrogenase component